MSVAAMHRVALMTLARVAGHILPVSRPHVGNRRSRGLALADEKRYRAVVRRRLLRQGRVAFLLVPLIAIFSIATQLVLQTPGTGLQIAINIGLGALALAMRPMLGSRAARRYPEVFLASVPLAAAASMTTLALLAPQMALVAATVLLLLPVSMALFIWWHPLAQAGWSACYVLLAIPGFAQVGPAPGTATTLLLSVSVSIALGLLGGVLIHRMDRRLFMSTRHLATQRAELNRTNRLLEASVRQDPLTGAHNRLRLTEDLAVARAAIRRSGRPWGLLAYDLDHFKAINDLYGHAMGDAVLKSVTGAAISALRPSDGVYRVGGEEFVALLSEMEEAEITAVADRLRRAVAGLAIPNPGNLPYEVVTISLGVTVLDTDDLELDDDGWLARADDALYAAKDAGRNRIEIVDRRPPRHLGRHTRDTVMVAAGQ